MSSDYVELDSPEESPRPKPVLIATWGLTLAFYIVANATKERMITSLIGALVSVAASGAIAFFIERTFSEDEKVSMIERIGLGTLLLSVFTLFLCPSSATSSSLILNYKKFVGIGAPAVSIACSLYTRAPIRLFSVLDDVEDDGNTKTLYIVAEASRYGSALVYLVLLIIQMKGLVTPIPFYPYFAAIFANIGLISFTAHAYFVYVVLTPYVILLKSKSEFFDPELEWRPLIAVLGFLVYLGIHMWLTAFRSFNRRTADDKVNTFCTMKKQRPLHLANSLIQLPAAKRKTVTLYVGVAALSSIVLMVVANKKKVFFLPDITVLYFLCFFVLTFLLEVLYETQRGGTPLPGLFTQGAFIVSFVTIGFGYLTVAAVDVASIVLFGFLCFHVGFFIRETIADTHPRTLLLAIELSLSAVLYMWQQLSTVFFGHLYEKKYEIVLYGLTSICPVIPLIIPSYGLFGAAPGLFFMAILVFRSPAQTNILFDYLPLGLFFGLTAVCGRILYEKKTGSHQSDMIQSYD